MAVTCKDIMELETCRRLRLIGGQGGLDHIVSWPYIKNSRQKARPVGWAFYCPCVDVGGRWVLSLCGRNQSKAAGSKN